MMAQFPGAMAWLLLLFGMSVLGTVFAQRYAIWRDLMDHPGERRSHVVATPRGGGIGIALALLVALWVGAWRYPAQVGVMLAIAAGLLLVAGIGWFDDHRPLTPWSRLAVHALASALLAAVAYSGTGQWHTALIAFALAMVLVNIWNFMDGIDGIATTQAVVVACACAALAVDPLARWMSLALAAACLGFLPFNLVNARIFLGDVGSGALGYAIAAVMVLMVANAGSMSPSAWIVLLLPPSAFLLDASLTLVSRILRGEHWWTAHVGHAYQRWARLAGRHWPVTLAYTIWALAASTLALSIQHHSVKFVVMSGIAWFLGGGIPWLWFQSRCAHRLPGK